MAGELGRLWDDVAEIYDHSVQYIPDAPYTIDQIEELPNVAIARLLAESVFANGLDFRRGMDLVFAQVSSRCPVRKDPDTGMLTHEGVAVKAHEEHFGDPNPTDTRVYHLTSRSAQYTGDDVTLDFRDNVTHRQFHAGGEMEQAIGELFVSADDYHTGSIKYSILLQGKGREARRSLVEANIDLPGGYRLDVSYRCDPSGNPLPRDKQAKGILVTWHNGKPCAPDDALLEHVQTFFSAWNLFKPSIERNEKSA